MKLKYNRGTARLRKISSTLENFQHAFSKSICSQVKGLQRLDFTRPTYFGYIGSGFLGQAIEKGHPYRRIIWKGDLNMVWKYKEYLIEGLDQNVYGITIGRRKAYENTYYHEIQDDLRYYVFLDDLPKVKKKVVDFLDTWIRNQRVMSLIDSKLELDKTLGYEIMTPDFQKLPSCVKDCISLKDLVILLKDYDIGRKEAESGATDKEKSK